MNATIAPPARDDLILNAADRLLARYGYKKMTMDDLAQEVGIGKGTIYLHFRSKEDVALSHVDRIVRRLLEQFESIVGSDEAPVAKLRGMLILRVMFRFDSVQHYTESITELLRDLRAPLLERRESYFEAEAKILATVVKEGQRLGVFRKEPPLPTARAMIAATNSLLPFSLSTQELGKRHEVEALARRIAELLLNGSVEN